MELPGISSACHGWEAAKSCHGKSLFLLAPQKNSHLVKQQKLTFRQARSWLKSLRCCARSGRGSSEAAFPSPVALCLSLRFLGDLTLAQASVISSMWPAYERVNAAVTPPSARNVNYITHREHKSSIECISELSFDLVRISPDARISALLHEREFRPDQYLSYQGEWPDTKFVTSLVN